MGRPTQDVTDAELRVLRVLWEQGPLSIRGISEIIEPKRTDAYYSTVKKLLERLESKGFVSRAPQGVAYIYEAVVQCDELVGRRLRDVAETLCEGSLTPLLTQLAKHDELTTKQQAQLMKLIDDLAQSKPRNTKSTRRRT